MKKCLPLLVPLLLIASCASLTAPDIARISAGVQEAARFGTAEAVRDHPEWRPTFLLVSEELTKLSLKDKLTVADLLDAVAKLPVSELSSDTARLIMAGARLTIALANWSEVEIVQTSQIRPVVKALADGITGGLSDSPAAAMARLTTKHYKAK